MRPSVKKKTLSELTWKRPAQITVVVNTNLKLSGLKYCGMFYFVHDNKDNLRIILRCMLTKTNHSQYEGMKTEATTQILARLIEDF